MDPLSNDPVGGQPFGHDIIISQDVLPDGLFLLEGTWNNYRLAGGNYHFTEKYAILTQNCKNDKKNGKEENWVAENWAKNEESSKTFQQKLKITRKKNGQKTKTKCKKKHRL